MRTSIVDKKTVTLIFSQIFNRKFEEVISTGLARSDEEIQKEAIDEVQDQFSPAEISSALLPPMAEKKWKEQTKGHSISAILAKAQQGDAFPVELDDAVINLDGLTVPFIKARQDIVNQQLRQWIDHDLKWKKAYSRNMDVMLPVQGIMEGRDCTAGEALTILRGRK